MLLREEKETRVKGNSAKRALNDEPSFLLVELVAHALAQLLEFTLGLCIVGVDHEVLEMP